MTGIHVEGVTDDSTLLKHYLSRLGDNPATNRAGDWKSSVLAAGPPGYGQNSILNEEVQGFLLGHRILQGLPYELDPILTAR
jgi:hypothetical protein